MVRTAASVHASVGARRASIERCRHLSLRLKSARVTCQEAEECAAGGERCPRGWHWPRAGVTRRRQYCRACSGL